LRMPPLTWRPRRRRKNRRGVDRGRRTPIRSPGTTSQPPSAGRHQRRRSSGRYNPRTMAQLFAGTSGWAYPSWKPDFYPQKLAQKKFLNFYATQLNAVEVNFTFRQLVKESTLQNWLAETPAEFRFTVKAHQVITHIKRLKGTEDFLPRFLGTIEPLASAGRLAPVLFQLPPNLKVDQELLATFLTALPRRLRSAFEFRHDSWFAEETYANLRQQNAALCVAETEERTTPDVVTAD